MIETKIKSMTWTNFLSYGSNLNEITFDNEGSIIWIKGPNGAGKSVIIDALSFGWFGQPYRSLNKNKGVSNTANMSPKATTIVTIDWDRIHGDIIEHWSIKRRMTKSGTTSLQIFKDNVEQDKTAGMSQKKLENEILGFDYIIFENIISLNTIQTIPIIDMTPEKKRNLLESVATAHIDKFKDANKKKLKDMQIKFTSASNDFTQYTKDVKELTEILNKLEEEKKAGIKDLEEQIEVLNEKIIISKKEKDIFEENLNKVKSKGISKKAEFDKYNGINEKISNFRNILTHLDYLSVIPANIKKKEELCNNISINLNKYKEELDKLKFDQIEYDLLIKELDKKTEDSSDYFVTSKIYENDLKSIENNAKMLKIGSVCPTCGKLSTEEDVEKIKKEYRNNYKELNKKFIELNNKIKICDTEINDIKHKKEEMDNVKEQFKTIKLHFDTTKNNFDKESEELKTLIKSKEIKENQIKELLEKNGVSKVLSSEEINQEINTLNNQLNIQNELNKEISNIRVEATQLIEKTKSLNNILINLNEQITSLTDKINKKNSDNIDDSCATTSKKLNNTKEDLERANERIVKYSDEVEICKYIEEMYDDHGLKQMILSTFVPNFNKAVAHNLKLFELPFSVEFNEAMEYTFNGKFGLAQEYGGLSQGQRRKLNFGISIAFRDFVATIADFKINILFLDEVLDISTDDEALSHMLGLLKTKVQEIGQIYVMTHRGQYFKEMFDHIIEVSHDGRYSSLKKIK